MSDAPLVIDVVPGVGGDADVVVLVEPGYAVPAAAAALDAGWGSVELAQLPDGDAPIPLVSFEQPPAVEHRGGRCRIRSCDLHLVAREALEGPALVLLGSPVLARPLASRLSSRAGVRRIAFVLVPSGDDAITHDALWAAGMLIRVVLEELDDRDSRLTDAAGIAVAIAQGAEPVAAELAAGARWRRHLERGGHPDDLRVASAVDTIGIVPELLLDGDAIVARPWVD